MRGQPGRASESPRDEERRLCTGCMDEVPSSAGGLPGIGDTRLPGLSALEPAHAHHRELSISVMHSMSSIKRSPVPQGWISITLVTSSLLKGLGISAGPVGTTALTAAYKWIAKDGIGAAGRLLVGGKLGAELDDDPRRSGLSCPMLLNLRYLTPPPTGTGCWPRSSLPLDSRSKWRPANFPSIFYFWLVQEILPRRLGRACPSPRSGGYS